MSLQDLMLICRGQRPRTSLAARAWRGLSRALERPESPPALDRHEPTLDLPPRAMTVGSPRGFAVARGPDPREAPREAYEPYAGAHADRRPPAPARGMKRRRLVREREPEPDTTAEFELTTEARSRDMAQRFAPSRNEPAGGFGFGLFRRRAAAPAPAAPPAGMRARAPKPIWPGSVPVPVDEEIPVPEHDVRPVGDQLYGRAVALVRAQRKASTAYLQQSLGIGYMRAADLIDRMEREGIVGAPVNNGIRPILTAPLGPRIV